ncbi:hypothetical protein BDN70DRAFT_871079 [Pholiota conissans]|uniref:Uncharacterized protein n=1 Tax=Pholiota conissans TaxID=109636 RepID=A0A9P5ZD00_9AGAR|nr:hypothetical protein BDN70DRAFT_871079 [Pholiota conissans]
MAFLPFNVSYIIMTPKRVRLPGETPKSPTSPGKTSRRSQSLRWRGDLSTKAKSFRSLVGGKSTTTVVPAIEDKEKAEKPTA